MRFMLVGIFVLAPLCGGCLVLPVPNPRVEGAGVRAQVVDEDTGRPIENAAVSDSIHGEATKTDACGRFYLRPHIQWHAAYLWGVLSYPILPFTGDVVVPTRTVRVEAAGYARCQFDIKLSDGRTRPANPQATVLLAPPIRMNRSHNQGTPVP